MTQQENSLVVPVDQAAHLLSVSGAQIRSMVKAGQLESIKIGRMLRIKRASIDAFVDGPQEAK